MLGIHLTYTFLQEEKRINRKKDIINYLKVHTNNAEIPVKSIRDFHIIVVAPLCLTCIQIDTSGGGGGGGEFT